MNVPFGSFFSSFFNGGYFLGDLEVNDSCVTVRFLLLRSFRLPIIRAKHWSSEKPNRGYQASFSRQIPQDLSLLFLIKNKKKAADLATSISGSWRWLPEVDCAYFQRLDTKSLGGGQKKRKPSGPEDGTDLLRWWPGNQLVSKQQSYRTRLSWQKVNPPKGNVAIEDTGRYKIGPNSSKMTAAP